MQIKSPSSCKLNGLLVKFMKKYYKLFILLLVVSFIVPQIAFASWWNPFSWNIWNKIFYKTDTQTQVLENRVKELENKLNEKSAPTSNTTKADKTTEGATANSTQQQPKQPTQKSVQPVPQPTQQSVQQPDNQTTQYKKSLLDRAIKVYSIAKARSDYANEMASLIDNRITSLNSQIAKNQAVINSLNTQELKEAFSILNQAYSSDISMCQTYKSGFATNKKGFDFAIQNSISDANKISNMTNISADQYSEFDKNIKADETALPTFSNYQDKDVADFRSWVSEQSDYYGKLLTDIKKIVDYIGSIAGSASTQSNYTPSTSITNLYIPQPKSIQCYFRWYGTSGSMECY